MTSRTKPVHSPMFVTRKTANRDQRFSTASGVSFHLFLAEQYHADHGHEQQHRNNFKWQQVLSKQQFAERNSCAFQSWQRVAVQRSLAKGADENAHNRANGN